MKEDVSLTIEILRKKEIKQLANQQKHSANNNKKNNNESDKYEKKITPKNKKFTINIKSVIIISLLRT